MHPLSRWILERLSEREPLETTIVAAPSTASARFLRESLVREMARPSAPTAGILGLHCVTVPELARMLADRAGILTPERRPDPLEDAAVLRCALDAASGDGAIARYALTFGSALRHLASTIREWETADRPAAGATAPTPHRHKLQEFIGIAHAVSERSRGFATRGQLIDAGKTALASERFDPSRLRVLFVAVEPSPDLKGLLEAMVAASVRVEAWDGADGPPNADRRRDVEVIAAPDVENELRDAARACAKATREGLAWHEMVVAVPHFGPYARRLRRAFSTEGVPFVTAAETPLVAEPRAALHVRAARILFGRPKRNDYGALVGSPLLRQPLGAEEILAFDRASRRFGLGGHGDAVDDFTKRLRQDAARTGVGDAAAQLIDAWHAAAQAAARTHDAEARLRLLLRFVDAVLMAPEPAQERDALCAARLLDAFGAWQRALQMRPSDVDGSGFARTVEEVLGSRGMPILGVARDAADAVRIVTHAEALALPARRLQLCGFSRSMLPVAGPSEAILGSAERELLGMSRSERSRTLHRATLRRLVHHSAASRLALSHPKRDDAGKEVPPSPWLEEVERDATAVSDGVPPPHVVHRDLATHPRDRARAAVADGMCPRDLALAHLAFDDGGEDAVRAVAGPDGVAAWRNAHALDSFAATNLSRDGDLGPAPAGTTYGAARLAVTQLAQLARCPQAFLFAHVLGLRGVTLPPEPGVGDLPRDLLGNAIHATLEDLFARFREKLRSADRCEDLAATMTRAADPIFERHLVAAGSPLRREFPAVHGVLQRRWAEALHAAIRDDLRSLDAGGRVPEAVEREIEADLRIRPENGAAFDLPVQGRIDRIDRCRNGDELRVVDFKTSRSPQHEVDPAKNLKGDAIQLPAYMAMLEAQGEHVDDFCVRAVRPGLTGEVDAAFEYVPGKDWHKEAWLQHSFLETLGVLARLRERGAFVMTSLSGSRGYSPCTYCDYRIACRRLHPPSVERVRGSGVVEVERYDRLQRKSTIKNARFLDPPTPPASS